MLELFNRWAQLSRAAAKDLVVRPVLRATRWARLFGAWGAVARSRIYKPVRFPP
jgi:hypothetical protein